MFPISYKKTIETPVNYGDGERLSAILLQMLEHRLKAEDPARFLRDKNQIAFAGGSPFSWRLLTSINYGEITVVSLEDRLRVKYELWFNGLFILSLVLVIGMAVLGYTSDFSPPIIIFVFFWLFLFGGNYAKSVVGFNSFMQDAIKSSLSFKG